MGGLIVAGSKYSDLAKLESLVQATAIQTRNPDLQTISDTWTANVNRFLRLGKVPVHMFWKGFWHHITLERVVARQRPLMESFVQIMIKLKEHLICIMATNVEP
jgi:hypothetical protein